MKAFVNSIYQRHKNFWTPQNSHSFFYGIVFFVVALVIQHVAYNYIDYHISATPVGDLLLNNLPTLDLDFLIVQGSLLATLLVVVLLAAKPNYVSFSVKSLALFIIIRSFFVSLTHLGANLHQLVLDPRMFDYGIYQFLYGGKNDFFFSGHVGMTFLLALIFWRQKLWRYVFLAICAAFGVGMIFAHMHYSIDIFAAPFITYSIFCISKKFFRKDYTLTDIIKS